jgi:crotonobetainyl-CoA:carnitine CoA-transferase CaiB-like acyl-CoA transferase
VHFLSPAVLDQSVNDRTTSRNGNADIAIVPHGVYRSRGDDDWVAVACRDDADWHALAALLGRSDLGALTTPERRARERELDDLVGAWAADRSPQQAMDEAIAVGVAAHAVQNSGECMTDPQLEHLGHWVRLPHADHGTITVEGCRIALSETPADVHGVPPFLGQDTVSVLLEDLAYDEERLGELYGASALD